MRDVIDWTYGDDEQEMADGIVAEDAYLRYSRHLETTRQVDQTLDLRDPLEWRQKHIDFCTITGKASGFVDAKRCDYLAEDYGGYTWELVRIYNDSAKYAQPVQLGWSGTTWADSIAYYSKPDDTLHIVGRGDYWQAMRDYSREYPKAMNCKWIKRYTEYVTECIIIPRRYLEGKVEIVHLSSLQSVIDSIIEMFAGA